jgi:hypothetical protein
MFRNAYMADFGNKSKLKAPFLSSQSIKSTISLTAISTQSLLADPPSNAHRPAAMAGLYLYRREKMRTKRSDCDGRATHAGCTAVAAQTSSNEEHHAS